jgi:hypothetical protein
VYGKTEGGKLGWFKPVADIHALWEEHVIDDGLLDAHTLIVGDHCGNGKRDLLVTEIGAAGSDDMNIRHQPRLMIYANDGAASFTRHVIDEGNIWVRS